MSTSIARIRSTATDGRSQAPRFIQNQLRSLHEALIKHSQEIRNAISSDSGNSPAEVGIEFFLALKALKEQYAAVNFEKLIEEEYKIANGKDTPERRVPVGIVYIVPSGHTLFYSVIAPLSAAITAGNCVILELGPTFSELNSLLRKLLSEALDFDSFTIVDSRPNDEETLSTFTQVFGTQPNNKKSFSNQIISPSAARVVAIVDRTADVQKAAAALVTARFSFGGKSPYAPDLVLVNEFVAQEFNNAVVEAAAKSFARNTGSGLNGSAKVGEKSSRKVTKLNEKDIQGEGTSVLVSGSSGSILSVKNRSSGVLKTKWDQPVLAIHEISSLDDAIDLSNSSGEKLLATYLFAAPQMAKYLGQFIDGRTVFINQIPVSLLVGPAAPANYPISITTRYTKEIFTVPNPQFINPINVDDEKLNEVIVNGPEISVLSELVENATAALPPTGQKPGKKIGFFEQGILTGLTTILAPAALGVLALSALGIREVVRRVR